jgi:hypothetical protein
LLHCCIAAVLRCCVAAFWRCCVAALLRCCIAALLIFASHLFVFAKIKKSIAAKEEAAKNETDAAAEGEEEELL